MKKLLITLLFCGSLNAAVINYHAMMTGDAGSGTFEASYTPGDALMSVTWTWDVEPPGAKWKTIYNTDGWQYASYGSFVLEESGTYTGGIGVFDWPVIIARGDAMAAILDENKNVLIEGPVVLGQLGVPEPHEYGLVAGIGLLAFALRRRLRALIGIVALCLIPFVSAQDVTSPVETEVRQTFEPLTGLPTTGLFVPLNLTGALVGTNVQYSIAITAATLIGGEVRPYIGSDGLLKVKKPVTEQIGKFLDRVDSRQFDLVPTSVGAITLPSTFSPAMLAGPNVLTDGQGNKLLAMPLSTISGPTVLTAGQERVLIVPMKINDIVTMWNNAAPE